MGAGGDFPDWKLTLKKVDHIFHNNLKNNVLYMYVLLIFEKIIVDIMHKNIKSIHSLIQINFVQLNQNLFSIDD